MLASRPHLLLTTGLCGALIGCGGESGRPDGARPTETTTAVAPPAITPGQLFDWAQTQFAPLFPAGPKDQQLTDAGVTYTLRFYPGTGNYLGVGVADGLVYGLGAFSGNVIRTYGRIDDYACDVTQRCAVFAPDADGNLAAGPLALGAVSVVAGATVSFQGLGPLDQVIEVGSPNLNSEQMCTAPALPEGTARPVPSQSPLPTQLQPANQFSGPYRTYPAGIFGLTVGSDNCGYIEKTSACTAPNEVELASLPRAGGGTDTLCAVTPYLMSPANPNRPADNPPRANPACVANRTMDSTWADPGLQGMFLRMDWKTLNPAYDVYDWEAVDREFAKAVRWGKSITMGIRVGNNAIPEWAFATGHPTLGPVKKVVLKDWDTQADALPNADCGLEYTVASPSDAAFRALFKKAITDLAAHVRADQRRFRVLSGVKVTGMGMHTLENRLPKRCNIAVANPALGDTGTQGHIVAMESTSLSRPLFDDKYSFAGEPAKARIRDTSQCVCNPQVLQFAGYRPSAVRSFYNEIEALLLQQFGHKQMVFMNISNGFPQVGEGGRFLGDHLVPPIVAVNRQPNGQTITTYGQVQASRAREGIDIPEESEITRDVIADARAGVYAGGDATIGRGFGVENAALNVIGFHVAPNQGQRCSQQADIATSGTFAGSARFPIPADARVDGSGAGCPNPIAAREGIAYNKAGGFQVVNDLASAVEIDAALWNMTLNTNGLFFEFYESDAWVARKASARNAGGVLNPNPAVRNETATPNHGAATAKSTAAWNSLLLARAAAFSADPLRANPFQANPYPAGFEVPIVSAPRTTRWFFNSRACRAWGDKGTAVRINAVTIAN